MLGHFLPSSSLILEFQSAGSPDVKSRSGGPCCPASCTTCPAAAPPRLSHRAPSSRPDWPMPHELWIHTPPPPTPQFWIFHGSRCQPSLAEPSTACPDHTPACRVRTGTWEAAAWLLGELMAQLGVFGSQGCVQEAEEDNRRPTPSTAEAGSRGVQGGGLTAV